MKASVSESEISRFGFIQTEGQPCFLSVQSMLKFKRFQSRNR